MDNDAQTEAMNEGIVLKTKIEAEKIIKLFGEMEEQNEEIKEIKTDQKAMIDLFCEQNENYTKKQIKTGYKYFIKVIKDRSKVTEAELEREKIIELIEGEI